MAWEARVKAAILKWKNIRQRMLASGMVEGAIDASNIELHRPRGGGGELNMHNEQIEGAKIFLPPPGSGPASVFTDEEMALIDPEIRQSLGLLSNEARARIKSHLQTVMALGNPAPAADSARGEPERGQQRAAAPAKPAGSSPIDQAALRARLESKLGEKKE